jgi:uncharacterized membrane protein YdbT with pleckstrin-like domain
MTPVNRPDGWGPSHQTEPRRRWIALPPVLLFALAVVMLIASALHYCFTGIAIALILVLLAIVVVDTSLASPDGGRARRRTRLCARAEDFRRWR